MKTSMFLLFVSIAFSVTAVVQTKPTTQSSSSKTWCTTSEEFRDDCITCTCGQDGYQLICTRKCTSTEDEDDDSEIRANRIEKGTPANRPTLIMSPLGGPQTAPNHPDGSQGAGYSVVYPGGSQPRPAYGPWIPNLPYYPIDSLYPYDYMRHGY